jgi:hypothetical protein
LRTEKATTAGTLSARSRTASRVPTTTDRPGEPGNEGTQLRNSLILTSSVCSLKFLEEMVVRFRGREMSALALTARSQ